MPCRDYEPYPSTRTGEDAKIKEKLDKVTALLCGLCRKLEGQELFNHILTNTKELNSWWKEHQKKDKKEAERLANIKRKKLLREKALSKLTLEERKILGLK